VANLGRMNAAPTTVKALGSFRSSLIVSLVIAVLGIAVAFVTAPGAMDEAIKVSMFLTLLWAVWVVFAFPKFKWRALWFLVGMPLTGWWLIVLYLIASGCAHNIKNCP
jgi:hypothetical protein